MPQASRCRGAGQPSSSDAAAVPLVDARGRGRAWPSARLLTPAHAVPEPVDGLPAGGAVRRGQLRDLAGDLCLGAVVPRLQFLLHRAALHVHDRRAARAARAGDLSGRRRHDVGAGRARARAGAASRPAACAPCGGSTNSPAGFRRWRRSTLSPRRRRARSTPASGGRPSSCSAAGRRSVLDRRLAAGGRARHRRHDGGALGLQHDEPAGADTARCRSCPGCFVPLRTPRGRVGVVGVAHGRQAPPLDSEARALLDTLAEQTAAALERARSRARWWRRARAAETERVRNTLLASISHDFRTPLASILGRRPACIDYGDKLDARRAKRPARPDQGRGRGSRRDGAQPARHDPDRCRRAGAAAATGSTCARSSTAS